MIIATATLQIDARFTINNGMFRDVLGLGSESGVEPQGSYTGGLFKNHGHIHITRAEIRRVPHGPCTRLRESLFATSAGSTTTAPIFREARWPGGILPSWRCEDLSGCQDGTSSQECPAGVTAWSLPGCAVKAFSDSEAEGTSTRAIVGICVGAVVLLFVLCLTVKRCGKKRVLGALVPCHAEREREREEEKEREKDRKREQRESKREKERKRERENAKLLIKSVPPGDGVLNPYPFVYSAIPAAEPLVPPPYDPVDLIQPPPYCTRTRVSRGKVRYTLPAWWCWQTSTGMGR